MEGYIIIYDDSTNLSRSINRICSSFQSDLFETSVGSINADLANAKEQKYKIRELLEKGREQFWNYLNVYNPLKDLDDVSLVMVYKQFLKKDQIIYSTLNMFKSCKTLLVGLVWVPSKFKDTFF
jgi:V-type H+-transporting ATPase subunit a